MFISLVLHISLVCGTKYIIVHFKEQNVMHADERLFLKLCGQLK